MTQPRRTHCVCESASGPRSQKKFGSQPITVILQTMLGHTVSRKQTILDVSAGKMPSVHNLIPGKTTRAVGRVTGGK